MVSDRSLVVDAWAQPVLADVLKKLPEIRRLFEQSGSGDLLDAGVSMTPEQTVSLMDVAGVDKVLLNAWHRPGMPVITNECVAQFCREFPDRFVGVAAVDLHDPVGAVAELDRCVTELGFKALRILPWLWKLPPNDKLCYPLYVKCVELGLPVCTQVGHTGPLMPSEPGRPIPYLDEVALTFPDLVIVGGHIGYPWTDEMIGMAWKYPNVYIDTSAYLPRYYPPQLVHFMKTNGRKKVLFGTNFPQLMFDKCVTQVHKYLELGDAEADFLGGNAARVFGLS